MACRTDLLIDDDASSTHLADYSYLGSQTFVITDYTQPDVKWTLADLSGGDDPDTGDIYSGFDRFGRVKDNRWYDYGSSVDVDRIKYGYDRAGNRTWRENTVAASLGKDFDELYGHDLIHRLKDMARGTLDSEHSSLDTETFAQCWSLDETGNWKKFLEDTDGDGTWDLNQSRSTNKVNEITDVTESTGPSWVTPAYNKAGNMTTVPQPADLTKSYTATYDAWNRLVKLVEGANTVSEYEYDAAKRRTIQKPYSAGVLDETRHLYYTEPSKWQVVEERIDASTNPDRQFAWGLRYVDDLTLRDRDTTANGTLDERLYALQDANWNATAIVDSTGAVQERFAYTAYGEPAFLDALFNTRASSSYACETLYAGYRWERSIALYHVRHRVYNTSIGTWNQRDAFISLEVQLYEYVDSSPLMFVDPTGLAPQGNRRRPRPNQQCVRACEDFCVDTFGTSLWNPLLLSCIGWCPAVCEGNWLTPGCSYIRNWSDCQFATFHCACGILGGLDILPAGLVPIAGDILEVLIGGADCGCSIFDDIVTFCVTGNTADDWWWLGIQTVFTILDCLVDVVSVLSAPLWPLESIVVTAIEAVIFAFDQASEVYLHGHTCFHECQQLKVFGGPCRLL